MVNVGACLTMRVCVWLHFTGCWPIHYSVAGRVVCYITAIIPLPTVCHSHHSIIFNNYSPTSPADGAGWHILQGAITTLINAIITCHQYWLKHRLDHPSLVIVTDWHFSGVNDLWGAIKDIYMNQRPDRQREHTQYMIIYCGNKEIKLHLMSLLPTCQLSPTDFWLDPDRQISSQQ